jgi:general stress protein YciG
MAKFNSDTASNMGRRGGEKTAQDREHMREIGRRGGLKAQQRLAEKKQQRLLDSE